MSLPTKSLILGAVMEGIMLGRLVFLLGGPSPQPLYITALHGVNCLVSGW